jgi:hypothetical protein
MTGGEILRRGAPATFINIGTILSSAVAEPSFLDLGDKFALSLLSDVERYRIERLGLGVLPLCSFSDQMPQFFISLVLSGSW